MGHPKLKLLASHGVATFVVSFSITLNARYTHIKQTHEQTQNRVQSRLYMVAPGLWS